ncbi:hypothetical protein ACGFYU_06795 [Streptomyces sp. NPDC048337]|uniref:hypothetical protein n=1 Tax=Streptomyces sp. NPDC048337 TaxID=3365535 RepID=UPI003712CF04
MRQGWGHGPLASPRGGHPRRGAPGRPPGRPGRAVAARYGPGRAAAAVLVLLAAAAAVGTPAYAGTAPGGPKERDAQLVYCLDAAHRADLVTAATRLGFLRPGPTFDGTVRPVVSDVGSMTPELWAERRKKDFGRACSALMAAASDSPGAAAEAKPEEGWFQTFLKSLPLLAAGALLTLGGQFSERVSSERRQLSRQLVSHEALYRTAVREYLAAYESDPRADHAAVATAREALRGVLTQVSGPASRRAAARRLAEELPLIRPLPAAQGGGVLGTEDRTRLGQEVWQSVETQPRAVMEINRRAPYWRWRALRERSAGAAPEVTA